LNPVKKPPYNDSVDFFHDKNQSLGARMKTIDNKNLFSASDEQMEELRKELREGISCQEFNSFDRLDALEEIVKYSHVDSATFHRLWIRPLLTAGLSLQVAIDRVLDSYCQPN